jgi:hypothetical protein
MTVRPLALVALAAVGAVVGACGGSGYQYLTNSDDDVFFKVPDEWAVYEEGDVLTSEITGSSERDTERLRARTWLRGFVAGPEPGPAVVLTRGSAYPRGFAEVRRLTPAERDRLSLRSLRSASFGFDPLTTENESVEVLAAEEIEFSGGYHGMRLLVALGDDDRSVNEETVVVDAATTRLYRFSIGCSEDCYEENRDLLGEVAGSWTVEETS